MNGNLSEIRALMLEHLSLLQTQAASTEQLLCTDLSQRINNATTDNLAELEEQLQELGRRIIRVGITEHLKKA